MEHLEKLQYNTERSKLIIPEYGRHLQKMVAYAISIEDDVERNKIARSIISVMGNLQPHLRDVPDFQHKLWDQLFIISDFKLKVDSPYPIATEEMFLKRPDGLAYPQNFPKYRFYGNNIKRMIDVAISWEKGDMRDGLEYAIANHMKKCYLNWNKDTVEDKAIFKHLLELSDGLIDMEAKGEKLTDSGQFLKNRIAKTTASWSNNPRKGAHRNNNNNNNRNKKRY